MEFKLFFLLLNGLSFISFGQTMWHFKDDTVITFSYQEGDEFNTNKVNTEYWNYSFGWARSIYSNKEQQYYTDGKNHFVNNGTLKLTAKKENITARVIDYYKDEDTLKNNGKFYSLNKKTFNYSAGMLQTKKKFLRGYFECRFKVSKNKGYWPAFWLYGGSPNEEIDIFEGKSERENQVHIDTHCPNHCDYVSYFFQKKSYGGWIKTKSNLTEGFNVISCEWEKDLVKYFLNGECIGISKVSFNAEKHIVLDIAVPSNDGPFHPGPDENDSNEATFEVDYVRVWSQELTDQKNKTQNISEIFTKIEDTKPMASKSILKTKGKLTYGKKSDHNNEEIFISYFNNKTNIQLCSLGKIKENKISYNLTDNSQTSLQAGIIERQIFTIDKNSLQKGEFILTLTYRNKTVKKAFVVD